MKLFYSKTSPYSRKVRMMIHEKGLQQAITSVTCNPFDEAPELGAANPLGKVPTLILDDGSPLYDSPVICAYLDTLTPGRLIPESGRERWNVLRWEALCDGVLDAAYNIVMERRRDAQEQSAGWIAQWKTQVSRSLDHIFHLRRRKPHQKYVSFLYLLFLYLLDGEKLNLPELHRSPNRKNPRHRR